MKTISLLKILFVIMILAYCSSFKCVADDSLFTISEEQNDIMERQRDDFLMSRPSGIQEIQTRAIERALKGDFSELNSVRNSRKVPYSPSENVDVVNLKIGYDSFVLSDRGLDARLYRPKSCKKGSHEKMRDSSIQGDIINESPLPLLVYFHGGGWTIGGLESCAKFCDALAASGEMMVLAVDYRLSPEYPFPIPVEDCVAATYYAMRSAKDWGGDISLVSVGGDSSGGNLAIMTALTISDAAVKNNGLVPLRSVLTFYPVVKAYTDNSSSWREYGDFYALDSNLMDAFNKSYISGTNKLNQEIISKTEVLASPMDADISLIAQLPQTLIIAAGKDILRDQGDEFALKLADAGVAVKRIEFSQAAHLFITVDGQSEAFKRGVEMALEFLRK
ncbi:MAG: alpha/beta hydrolase [Prevotella sp.]|nr:alpha/beta hydrolase [Bacteroides sp.]MCM1366353.1 alpha/beta hydrolase [Prevotella sp.]MCM1436289.1 alpha/beta hydrolase [Prevotella sp.]